jgi:DNA-binding NtrC family response regulator
MSTPQRVLVADDEVNLRRVLSAILHRHGYEPVAAPDGQGALDLIDHSFAAVITDLKMPRVDGLALLRRLALDWPEIPVIVITAHGSVDSAVEAVKLGAFDYVEKPFDQEQILQVVAKAVRTRELARNDAALPELGGGLGTDPSESGDLPAGAAGRYELIGKSAAIRQVYQIVERVADTPSTVLLTGESGTGKELIARALHAHSGRRERPFIKINCAAIPEALMESELFGHERGSFTGAISGKPGRFELAHGGTLFLDEIGEIPVDMQVKLLRVLQESEFERVGGIKTLKVDVRVVAATNRDLEKEVRQGGFREDLFYRLNVVPIHLPPLRERREDVPALVHHFLHRFNERLKKRVEDRIVGVDAEAMERLVGHGWTGNIRELENVLERTVLFCDGPRLRLQDLPPELLSGLVSPAVALPTLPFAATLGPLTEESTTDSTSSLKEIVRAETERIERSLIVKALDATGSNVTQAAKMLKISRKSLQTKMKELGLRDRETER